MQKKKNVTRYGDDDAWISKLVPGCSSVAAERLKHHTVFFTALYWLVSSLAHSWTDFLFYFFLRTVTWTVVTAAAEWVKEAQTPLKVCWPHSRFKISTTWDDIVARCSVTSDIWMNDRLSQPQLSAVSVSLRPVDSPMRPHQKGWLWKQLIQPIFTFVVRLGPLVAVLIITVAKEEATWSSMKSKNILPWEEVGAWIGSCSCPLCDQKLMFSFT